MGSCTSKTKQQLENDPNNGSSTSGKFNKKKKKRNNRADIDQQCNSNDVDQFAHVPFIDSEEKLATTPPPSSPPLKNPQDEQTTVKTNFESNVSYSTSETIDRLKQEVLDFLREKIFPVAEEKEKLLAYVQKRVIGSPDEKKLIGEHLNQFLIDIEQHHSIDQENQIRNRLMHIITIYVASQSSENSFLKALYDKMGTSLDLNSLNAETNEREVVEITVTKRVRQVLLDGSTPVNINDIPSPNNTVIHLSNQDKTIPDDIPEDIRRKAEQVLNNFNEVIHSKPH